MMTQDDPEDPDTDSEADSEAAAGTREVGTEVIIDVVTRDAFLDALKQATTPEDGVVVPLVRKPGPRAE
ncbi:hypothetical protein ACSSV6_003950 [Roseovarius sp. MBR-38]